MADRIKSDYDKAQNKDVLFAEIEARRAEGRNIPEITTSSLRDEMEAALELDDEDAARAPKPPLQPQPPKAAAQKPSASGIPQVTVSSVPEVMTHNPPQDHQFTDGIFVSNKDGLEYALCIHAPDNYGRTHTLKNSANTIDVTEKDFRLQFDKK